MRIRQFRTERTLAQDWQQLPDDPQARAEMIAALAEMLTPEILEHLPPSFQPEAGGGGIPSWIAARQAESQVMAILAKTDKRLIGLLFIAPDPTAAGPAILHIGYLLAGDFWGQGIASELLNGLALAARSLGPAKLHAGVGVGNPASARVLEKAGFVKDPLIPTPHTRFFTRHVDRA